MLNLFKYNGHIFSRNLLTNQQAQSHQNLVYNRTWLLTKPYRIGVNNCMSTQKMGSPIPISVNAQIQEK